MKIDFNQSLSGLDGEPLKDPKKYKLNQFGQLAIGEDGLAIVLEYEPVTLSKICCEALMGNKPNEEISGDEKLSRYILAMKIRQAKGLCEVTADEIVKIKKLVGEFMKTLVVGAAFELLEGKGKKD